MAFDENAGYLPNRLVSHLTGSSLHEVHTRVRAGKHTHDYNSCLITAVIRFIRQKLISSRKKFYH
jgi:hypothetical protein